MRARFLDSIATLPQLPQRLFPEVTTIGRSNCGKSSLMNALMATNNLVKTSSRAGHTASLNIFELNDGEENIYFVDLPGYGYSEGGKSNYVKWEKLINKYLDFAAPKRYCLFLCDSRRDLPQEDYNFLAALSHRFTTSLVWTKTDKLKQKDIAKLKKICKELLADEKQNIKSIHWSSTLKKKGITELRNEIFTWAKEDIES